VFLLPADVRAGEFIWKCAGMALRCGNFDLIVRYLSSGCTSLDVFQGRADVTEVRGPVSSEAHPKRMKRESRKGLLIGFSLAALAILAVQRCLASESHLQTVPSVDLARYSGTWYEIARYPNWFQRKCSCDTGATYTLRPDGKVSVVNACRRSDGRMDIARGLARVADKRTNARLKVSFFWPFSGDYWIIGLGGNYEYAVIGEPGRKYLWILSRTPQLDATLYAEAVETARRAGYNPERLMNTPQNARGAQ
jgi:apolipoprotein D and lipocalin family protein